MLPAAIATTTMKSITVFQYVLSLCFFFFLSSDNIVSFAEAKRIKKKIGLLTASLPWTFGPYQAQMHQLSLLLAEEDTDAEYEYDIHWLCFGDAIPDGVYKSYKDLQPRIPKLNPPPEDFPMDHLTFLGDSDMLTQQFSASRMNTIAKKYRLDLMITLMDITKTVPDEPFNMPVLAWIPLHSDTVRPTTVDYWVLRSYHGIAGLAPSGAIAINNAVGTDKEINIPVQDGSSSGSNDSIAIYLIKKLSGTVEVEFIPHIIDRQTLTTKAKTGLKLLNSLSSVAEVDSKLTNQPLINRGQESSLEIGHNQRSIFGVDSNGNGSRKDDFIVLLQGGNYDSEDRKGWDTSLQAFVQFYNSLDESKQSSVHLLIHSMESYLIASDHNLDADAPAAVLPQGNRHHLILHEYGLPRDVYTIDIARHASEVIAAYKTRADVCLHPSKVEGFGMNVMECQAVGTPVITTNYTAMGDFTKLGRAVSPRQMIRNPGTIYEMALPDVAGVADALTELHEEHLAMKRGDKKALARRNKELTESNEWIDTNFSPTKVGSSFKSLLRRTQDEYTSRMDAKQSILSSSGPPTSGSYQVASGYHLTIVDWDTPWTLIAPDGLQILDNASVHRFCWSMLLTNQGGSGVTALILPAVYEDGTPVPIMDDDGSVHNDLPVLVRTYMITALQGRASRKKSIAQMVLQNTQMPRRLPDGLAVVVKNKKQLGGGEYDNLYNQFQNKNNEL